MSIQELTHHPEKLNRETLYELRRVTALYPYYQPARLLLLKNLYLLHDPAFDEELRRSSIYFTDRRILFNLIETAHYRLKRKSPQSFNSQPDRRTSSQTANKGESRTVSLIDTYLSTVPDDEMERRSDDNDVDRKERKHRKPTAADATVDYVAYLLSTDFEELSSVEGRDDIDEDKRLKMNGGDLIDAFIKKDGGRFSLQEEPELHLEIDDNNTAEPDTDEDFLTETLAGIYVKQGRYEKALDIIDRINKTEGNKSRYYEDQQRFLKKLILIQNNNKQK